MPTKYILASLFALTFILITSLTLVYTRAASTLATTTAEVINTAPLVETINFSNTAYGADIYTSTGFTPSVGTDKPLHITGTISDANGVTDIASTSLIFYRSSASSTCTTDKNDCYTVTSCAINTTPTNDTATTYNCPLDIAFWIDATDAGGHYPNDSWIAAVTVSDLVSDLTTNTATTTINSLLALNIPETINYGTRTLNEESTTANNVELSLTQRGNTKADVEIQGTPMTCSILGTIPVANQKYALTDLSYASSTATLSTTQTRANRDVDYRTDDNTQLASSLFWNIKIPQTGVKGLCTGSNTISLIALQSTQQGTLVDAPIANIAYQSTSHSGRTTASGQFDYVADETTTFSIGSFTLGAMTNNAIDTDKKVFFTDIFGLDRGTTTPTKLVNALRFIQSLDTDNDPSTSNITIPETAHTALNTAINLDSTSEANLQTQMQKVHASRTLKTALEARQHFAATLSSNGVQTFAAPTLTITSATSSVTEGSATTLSWSTTNAESCTASNGWSGTKATSGTNVTTGNLSTTTTFTLMCEGLGGSVSKAVSINTTAPAGVSDVDGNTYGTVTIGVQTWLNKNMNVGTMLAAATNQTNNGTVEKWCNGANGNAHTTSGDCATYGALYTWNEAMQYSTTEGAQGICPSGYHIPTDAQYKTLEMYLGMSQAVADATDWRGTDEGTKLKAGGSSGFEAPLSGYRSTGGTFNNRSTYTYLWSSSMSGSNAWRRLLSSGNAQVYRLASAQAFGFSVRCLKD